MLRKTMDCKFQEMITVNWRWNDWKLKWFLCGKQMTFICSCVTKYQNQFWFHIENKSFYIDTVSTTCFGFRFWIFFNEKLYRSLKS